MGGASSTDEKTITKLMPSVGGYWGNWRVTRIVQRPGPDQRTDRVGFVFGLSELTRAGQSHVLKICTARESRVCRMIQAQAHTPVLPNVVLAYQLDLLVGLIVLESFSHTLDKHPREHHHDTGVLQSAVLGLAWLHQRGILHNDVAPQNIGVRHDGTAALFDFGASLDLKHHLTPEIMMVPSRWPYAALGFHCARETPLHPADDLESLVYVWLERTQPSGLPWACSQVCSLGDQQEVNMLALKQAVRSDDSVPHIAEALRTLDSVDRFSQMHDSVYDNLVSLISKHAYD